MNTQFIIVLLLFGFIQIASAETLQRLFTTAAERDVLDELRRSRPDESRRPSPKTLNAPPHYIIFNAVVKNNRGKVIVWLNDSQSIRQKGFFANPNKMQGIKLPIFLVKKGNKWAEKPIWLKPGQAFDTVNKKIIEIYEPKPIIVKVAQISKTSKMTQTTKATDKRPAETKSTVNLFTKILHWFE